MTDETENSCAACSIGYPSRAHTCRIADERQQAGPVTTQEWRDAQVAKSANLAFRYGSGSPEAIQKAMNKSLGSVESQIDRLEDLENIVNTLYRELSMAENRIAKLELAAGGNLSANTTRKPEAILKDLMDNFYLVEANCGTVDFAVTLSLKRERSRVWHH